MAEKRESSAARDAGGAQEKILDVIDDEIRRALDGTDAADPEQRTQLLDTISLVNRLEEINAIDTFPSNDMGTARLFAEIFKSECRYSPTAREWMCYDNTKWTLDLEGMYARRRCKALADAMSMYAVSSRSIPDGEKRTAYMKYAASLSAYRVRNTAVNDARDINSFTTEEMDSDDYLLNVLNGTLDLHGPSPVCREHDPDDLLSKCTNVIYDPAAACPRWEQAIDEIMESDAEKIRYLQKLCGLCLTGDTRREEMYFFFGSTSRNGKSTITETLLYILGDYGETISPETLATKANKDSRSASPDIAKLSGARLVIASEPPKRMPFDTSLVKTLTGRDRITARHLYQNEFSFIPKCKLIISTNYLPSVNDPTVFLSGRIRVVEFNRHFDDKEQDRELKDKLRGEASGILNWMLEGLQMYKSEGLDPPEAVLKATKDYSDDSDKLGKFLDENMVRMPGKNSKAGEVYKLYETWTQDNGYGTESKGSFFGDLRTKGLFGKSGTVHGKTEKNVICGYVTNEDAKSYTFMDVDPDEPLPF